MTTNTPSRANRNKKTNKQAPKKPKTKKKRSAGTIIFRIFASLFILGMLLFLGGVGLFWYYAKDAPKIDETSLESAISSTLLASNGESYAELGTERRETITPQEVPQLLEDAIVSVEDKRFYKHIGIDPIRIIGSAVSNLKSDTTQGGSTLTQQLIKLSFFSTKASDQTLKRKAQEAWMAIQLEKQKSKQEILTYYINKVYMSNGISGMETASQAYFGKSLSELNLAQTALIAGMPQAPETYDPYKNPDLAKERRDIVLYTMKENKKITDAEYKAAIDTPITDGLIEFTNSVQNWVKYDGYVNEVIQQVKELTGKNVYTDGLEVYTNLDLDAQNRLYDIVNTANYVAYPDSEMQVAATLMDAKTGKVTAQIGGRNIDASVVLGNNLAVNTSRDFGSTMKPITDYGPAFEYLKDSTGARIEDEPYTYPGTNIQVNNWDMKYMGNISLRTALSQSRNVPAVKLLDEVGVEKSQAFLKSLGIEYANMEISNAISSNTTQEGTKYGASSEKMAAAYSAFANGGTYYKPMYISKIVYQDGSYDEFNPDGTKAMEAGTAYMVTDVLKDVITQGTGTNAQISGLIQAGKTGTSNYSDADMATLGNLDNISPDVTFAGYTPDYSLAVWTGYNDHMTPVTELSNMVASDVYRELMQYVTRNSTVTDWEMPNDLIKVGNELYWKDTYVAPTVESSVVPSSSSVSVPSSSSTVESITSETSTTQSIPESTTTPESSTTPSSTTPSESTPESSTTPSSDPPTSSSTPPDQGNNQGNGNNAEGTEQDQT
ncbi:PBP1A family penicillin-binding protein [Enterococcus asini]|uniref:transglycosylase domain-containing protein n=1 Tax=Enterococcus asini TaxID=57732 RepID=UPI00288F153C|nr:PBP1A family penicillin-binding protein [Enterococcus asini]MDT2757820.1 PBP1A family penicillin-binding protein [Enterococcus asini]